MTDGDAPAQRIAIVELRVKTHQTRAAGRNDAVRPGDAVEQADHAFRHRAQVVQFSGAMLDSPEVLSPDGVAALEIAFGCRPAMPQDEEGVKARELAARHCGCHLHGDIRLQAHLFGRGVLPEERQSGR